MDLTTKYTALIKHSSLQQAGLDTYPKSHRDPTSSGEHTANRKGKGKRRHLQGGLSCGDVHRSQLHHGSPQLWHPPLASRQEEQGRCLLGYTSPFLLLAMAAKSSLRLHLIISAVKAGFSTISKRGGRKQPEAEAGASQLGQKKPSAIQVHKN